MRTCEIPSICHVSLFKPGATCHIEHHHVNIVKSPSLLQSGLSHLLCVVILNEKAKKKKSILILQIVSHTAIFTHKWITISFGRHAYSTPLTYCQSSSRGSSSLNSTVTRLSHNVNFIVDTSTPRATICSR